MDDSAIERHIPVQIIDSKGANRADYGGGILENGGEARDAGLGDCFEDDFCVGQAGLRASAVNAVRDLDAVSRGGIFRLRGNRLSGKTREIFRGFFFFRGFWLGGERSGLGCVDFGLTGGFINEEVISGGAPTK